jgi:serine/threonine-protein kinase HipA
MTENLDIFLNNIKVGVLTRLPDSRTLFSFDKNYISDINRPILSQSYFSADGTLLTDTRSYNSKIPPFFSNLLPEGHLREYLAALGSIKPNNEFDLLKLLGEDLPGAVIVRPTSKSTSYIKKNNNKKETPRSDKVKEQILRFSLAGVQLKFSALMERQGGLTIPASGIGGDWIIKLPSPTHDNVPENEYAMMHMASEVGIPIPEIKLVPLSNIAGLPEFGKLRGANALAVKRFDRTREGHRIHIEDFAQVYNIFPENKYKGVSFNNIAGMIWVLTGENGLKDYISRLVYTILIGNGDMHLKNWSFIYSDKHVAELSPAYDMVSTVPYIPNDRLALKLVNTKDMKTCNLMLFEKLVEKVGLPKKLTLDVVRATVETTRTIWAKNRKQYSLPLEIEKCITQHMKNVLLL